MSTLHDRPTWVHHDHGCIRVIMESGLEISFPIAGNRRLEGQPARKLDNIELSPCGIHWPDLDEDLSIRGILTGDYGQRPSRTA